LAIAVSSVADSSRPVRIVDAARFTIEESRMITNIAVARTARAAGRDRRSPAARGERVVDKKTPK